MLEKNKRYCSHGFDWVQIGHTGEPLDSQVINGDVYPCCPGWLKNNDGEISQTGFKYGNIYKNPNWEDIWNGDEAQKFRKSILDGSFKYCREDVCPHLQNISDKPSKLSYPPAVRYMKDIDLLYKERGWYHKEIIEKQMTKLPFGPEWFKMDYDRSCNLSCPSCRIEVLVAKGMDYDKLEEIQKTLDAEVIPSVNKLFITGSGDPFGSAIFRKFLQTFTKEKYPNIETIRLLSNGQLWTEEMWNSMPDIHDLVHMAEISVDAGSKEVYEKVRRGGDWNKLIENFEFISTLEIPYFGLSMVVQDSNYKDIPKLIEIRDKYFPNGYVYFQKITNWETFSKEEFEKKAVWKENHPEHKEFVKILKENVTDRLKDRVASNMVDLK